MTSDGNRTPDNLRPCSFRERREQGPDASVVRKDELDEGKTDPEPDMDSGRTTVRNVRSKCRCSCVLQFTLRRAVSCVLHRPSSQVIHCIEFCFAFRDQALLARQRSQLYSAQAGVGTETRGRAKTNFKRLDAAPQNPGHRPRENASTAALAGSRCRGPEQTSTRTLDRRGLGPLFRGPAARSETARQTFAANPTKSRRDSGSCTNR